LVNLGEVVVHIIGIHLIREEKSSSGDRSETRPRKTLHGLEQRKKTQVAKRNMVYNAL